MVNDPERTNAAEAATLVHARDRVAEWCSAWRGSGQLVVLLDFDGTLAPIVDRPEKAALPARTETALKRLLGRGGVESAIVSGRGLADARERVGIETIAYAGNHGMEIDGPGVHQIHGEAAAARPALERVAERARAALSGIEGAIVEDKGLTLSIHYRLVRRDDVSRVREVVIAAVGSEGRLRMTEGKEVLEVRPRVEWDKGRAVEFLLAHLDPVPGAPVLYVGDDTTDEDAFRALQSWRGGAGQGVIVGDPPPAHTAAASFVRSPAEVAELLELIADCSADE